MITLQGQGFESYLHPLCVCVEFTCVPRASGVSSRSTGFLPPSIGMRFHPIGMSKLYDV